MGNNNALLAANDLREFKTQIQQYIPNEDERDRLFTILLAEVQNTPGLAKCTKESILVAARESAKLGLEFGGTMQQLHIVPFGRKATLIVGYRGLVALMKRGNPDIEKIDTRAVHEGDDFHVNERELHHNYSPFATKRGDVVGYYAMVTLKSGTQQWEVMSLEEVDAIRDRARGYDPKNADCPWVAFPHQMGRKTVLRRMANSMELSTVTKDAISDMDKREFEWAEARVVRERPTVGVSDTLALMQDTLTEEAEPVE